MPCCRASVFIKRWQSTSNCDENISDTFLFLPHFDVICNLGRNLFHDHMINWIMHAFDWFLLVIYWRTDAQMTSLWLTFCLFYYIEQIDYMLSRVFTVVNESDPRSGVHYLGSSEIRPEKNSGLYGIWTHDLCDTGAALFTVIDHKRRQNVIRTSVKHSAVYYLMYRFFGLNTVWSQFEVICDLFLNRRKVT